MGVTNSFLQWEYIFRERGWQDAQDFLFTLKGGIRKQVLEMIANDAMRTVRKISLENQVENQMVREAN